MLKPVTFIKTDKYSSNHDALTKTERVSYTDKSFHEPDTIPPKTPRFYRYYILGALMAACTLFYYGGEIVDFFGLGSIRWSFLYAIHDFHRLLFFIPILYAAHAFGIRASIIITLISGGIWAPRAFIISPYPSPALRAYLSLAAIGLAGYLTALVLNKNRRIARLETTARTERNRSLEILRYMTDGVTVVGPDYRVRYANEAMKKQFGDGIGLPCYKYIYHYLEPCGRHCRLKDVIDGGTEKWEYTFPDGTSYMVVASPFVDSDGVTCQLATYRQIKSSSEVFNISTIDSSE